MNGQSGYNEFISSNYLFKRFQMNSTAQIIPEADFASVTRLYDKGRDDAIGSAMCFFSGSLRL